VLEPGRLRMPRDALEASAVLSAAELDCAFPRALPRVLVTHTRPEPMQGLLRRIDPGPAAMIALGYISRGGTLDVPGMLLANRCTWVHVVEAAAKVAGRELGSVLSDAERAALAGRASPRALLSPQ